MRSGAVRRIPDLQGKEKAPLAVDIPQMPIAWIGLKEFHEHVRLRPDDCLKREPMNQVAKGNTAAIAKDLLGIVSVHNCVVKPFFLIFIFTILR
jgi:hypothetical protein